MIPGVLAVAPGSGQAMVWTPTDLFVSGEQGAWYDPRDMSTLWQDTAGTVPVTADGQTVARMDDKSGLGRHMTQATAGSRPTFRDSGGVRWLQLDGTDDFLTATGLLMLFKNAADGALYGRYSWSGSSAFGSNYILAVETASGAVRAGIAQGGATSASFGAIFASARRLDADGAATGQTSTTFAVNTIHHWFANFNWATGSHVAFLGKGVIAAASMSTSSGNTSNTDSASVNIGRVNSSNYLKGNFYGGLLIDRTLGETDRSRLVDYFN